MIDVRRVAALAAVIFCFSNLMFVAAARPVGGSASTATSTKSSTKAPCPLTGRATPAGVDVRRAAVAVKVDNSGEAVQRGLQRADVVIEQPVEGGMTRLMAIYHCEDAATVGPVRSARVHDGEILAGLASILGYSGANEIVEEALFDHELVQVTESTSEGALFRTDEQDAPYNLFADTAAIRRLGHGAAAPSKALRFGAVTGRVRPVDSFALDFGGTQVAYEWSEGSWNRNQSSAASDSTTGVAIANVLVQEVDVYDSEELFDSVGNPSPEMDLSAGGRAFLFRNGKMIKGSWQIDDFGRTRFARKDGSRLLFAKGPTWIELLPSSQGSVEGGLRWGS